MGEPIVIGVTGHRRIREEKIGRLRKQVAQVFQKMMAEYQGCEFVLLDSVAAGADTFCAWEALALGMKLKCPLPFAAEEYRKDFSPEEVAEFDQLLDRAEEVFVAPDMETDCSVNRDYHYRQAGLYVAANCHVLLALWDGQPGKPGGCGAAEIVEFMLGESGPEIGKKSGAVLHIFTPREGMEDVAGERVRLIEKEPGSLREILRRLNDRN